MFDACVRYLHFLGIFILASTLVAEHLLITKEMTRQQFKRLTMIDGIYGLGAVMTLTGGLLLWFVVGKPTAFYTGNPIFHIKLTLFILMALLSLIPTVFFLRNRRSQASVITPPNSIIVIVRAELALLIVIALLATVMAQGIGLR